MGIGLRRRKAENIDEHGMPTEPAAPPVKPSQQISPLTPSARVQPPGPGSAGAVSARPQNMPARSIQDRLFPEPLASLFLPKRRVPKPSSASDGKGMPVPARVVPTGNASVQTAPPSLPERLVNSLWRNVVPPAIRLLCRLMQILLVLRFIGKLIHFTSANTWVNVGYVFSDVLLIPFHALLPPLDQGIFASLEPYTLLAIIVYGLCARLLIGVTKVFIDAHI